MVFLRLHAGNVTVRQRRDDRRKPLYEESVILVSWSDARSASRNRKKKPSWKAAPKVVSRYEPIRQNPMVNYCVRCVAEEDS